MGILLTVPVWVIFMLIGTTLFVFYKQQPLPEGLRPEAVFPYFIKTRLPVGVVGLISSAILIGIFYVNAGSEGVLGIVFTLYAILSGGIVGIFLLGLFSARANRQGVTIAIIVCILFAAYAFLTSTKIGLGENKTLLLDLGPYNFKHDKLMLGVYSHLVVIGVGYLASLFFPKPHIDSRLLYSGWRRSVRKEKLAVETA